MRIGLGYDVHKLVENRKLILGGVEIPYEKGLLGHSDADVLLHAIMDSLLGACALGDIGKHFPDTDDRFKGISSIKLLEETAKLINNKGYAVNNIDATIIAQKPKLAPYIHDIVENLALLTNLNKNQISVKAKTNEKMDSVGECKAIETNCVVLLKKIKY